MGPGSRPRSRSRRRPTGWPFWRETSRSVRPGREGRLAVLEPVPGAAQAFGERSLRAVAEPFLGALEAGERVADVAGAGRPVLARDRPAGHLLDHLEEVVDR